ncbi:MAG: hypothetical protein H6851_06360 [Geminicoccaceae bacterium]|nr:hypothetical protein [Geminicoccaceae bacterium]
MLKKNNWSIPGFTCIAMLSLSACGGGNGGDFHAGGAGTGTGAGSGGGTAPVVDFTVPNPYATYDDDNASNIGTLTVFGDSYSDVNGKNNAKFSTWAERVIHRTDGGTLDSYAKGEASANSTNVYYNPDPVTGIDAEGDDPDNTLRNQVDRYNASGHVRADNDLTVVYMGYNDVNMLWDDPSKGVTKLTSALNDYETEIGRLVAGGATAGDRKIFLTLIHDWDSTPKELARINKQMQPGGLCDTKGLTAEECAYKRQRTLEWNQRLVDIANANENIVAVDLFTVIDRVLADPSKFGFIDVTSAGGDNAVADDAQYLYFDNVHFGGHGQEIIAQVMNHYLTRGWDWANTLAAGSEAAAQIGQDIDNGLLLALSQLTDEQRLGLNSFVMGDGGIEPAAGNAGARSSFEQMRGTENAPVGFGLNYAFDDNTMMGFATSNYGNGSTHGNDLQSSRVESSSQAFAFYFNTEAAGIKLRTVASYSDDNHQRTEHDGLIGATDSASFGGRTMAISQTASLPLEIGGNWFTPWINLSHTVQQLDSYTLSNPYLSDTTYKGDDVSETYATIGLTSQSRTFSFGDSGSLQFSGRLSYSQSLALDDYKVNIREHALGYNQTETIKRDQQGILGLRLGAELGISDQLSLSANYAADKQNDADPNQSIRVGLTYRF